MRLALSTRTKIGIARLLYLVVSIPRRLLGKPDVALVRRRGIRWQLDLREGIDLAIYVLGQFEASTFRRYASVLRPGASVIDIGANIGAHTLPFARLVGPDGRVIAIEPTAYAYRKLKRNLSLNPALASHVQCAQLLLSDSASGETPTSLYASWPVGRDRSQHHPTHHGVPMGTTGATTDTLDAFLARDPGFRPDFIKIDVDGNECRVLRGARETLRRCRPTLLMELMPYGLEEAGCSLGELLEILREAGYHLYHIENLTPLPDGTDRVQALVPPGGSINVLGRPAQRDS